MLGSPLLPIRRGEIQTKGLGMDVRILDERGQECPVGVKGELTCHNSFPSMPLGFYGDEGGQRFVATCFSDYRNVWKHGDYAELTRQGGYVIHGRSDATLNIRGVRIGTAEIYRVVESLPEVVEALALQRCLGAGEELWLFVRLAAGRKLNPALEDKITRELREQASPRHLPARLIEAEELPRTRNGTLAELAAGKVLNGQDPGNLESLANPRTLELFRTFFIKS